MVVGRGNTLKAKKYISILLLSEIIGLVLITGFGRNYFRIEIVAFSLISTIIIFCIAYHKYFICENCGKPYFNNRKGLNIRPFPALLTKCCVNCNYNI
jgi:hypothetical protein